MFMRSIYFKNSTFLSLKIFLETLIDVRSHIVATLLKISQNKHITLLSDANITALFISDTLGYRPVCHFSVLTTFVIYY